MNDLFRKEALENFSSHSGINKGVRAVRIRTAVVAAFLCLCAAVFAIWLFAGTIYETVSVNGIIWPTNSNGEVYASTNGTISKIITAEGSEVKAGDIIAIVPQEDILAEIKREKANGTADEDLQKLYEAYDLKSVIRSNIDGIVTYVADENSYIAVGDLAANIVPYEKDGDNKKLTAFVSTEKSGLITLGAEAQVMPDFAPREKYGYIKAYVSGISSYPVTGQSIKETSNEIFLPTLDERGSYLQIEITLVPDANTQSRLKWSNPSSGDVDVAIGTLCGTDIVIKKCHPYEWLLLGENYG